LECLKEIDFRLNRIRGNFRTEQIFYTIVVVLFSTVGCRGIVVVKVYFDCIVFAFCVLLLVVWLISNLFVFAFVSFNHNPGTLPDSLCKLQRLEGLYLFDNYITGPIPEELSLLPELKGVYLYNNCFDGTTSTYLPVISAHMLSNAVLFCAESCVTASCVTASCVTASYVTASCVTASYVTASYVTASCVTASCVTASCVTASYLYSAP
jgi:hypothetical protein